MANEQFRPLNGLRGVAILVVIVHHAFSYQGFSQVGRLLNGVARCGWVGVTLFFVLSGFLISGILLDTQGRPHYWRDFFARRGLRIFPLYFAFLAVYLLVFPRLSYTAEHLPRAESPFYYCAYLTNMAGWLMGKGLNCEPLDPLWSLAVEEQVYLVWPLLILLVPRSHLPAVLVGLALSSMAWRLGTRLTAQSIEMSYAWTPANLESFAAGSLVAWMSRERPAMLRGWAPGVTAAAGCFLAGMWMGQRHFSFWDGPAQVLTVGITGLNLFFASLIAFSVSRAEQGLGNRLLSFPPLEWCGKFSYAMYLFHGSVVALLVPQIFGERWSRGTSVPGALILTLATVLVSFGLAYISWYLWERPFLSLKRFFPLSGRVVRPFEEERDTKHDA